MDDRQGKGKKKINRGGKRKKGGIKYILCALSAKATSKKSEFFLYNEFIFRDINFDIGSSGCFLSIIK